MKIVIAEKVSAATLAVFASEPSFNVVTHDQIKNGLAAEVADADALIVRSAVQADAALMEAAPKLRVIGRAGVGVDNIDADAATRHGIVVMNTPGANAIAVAELTLGVMLALARSIPRANSTMHGGKWEKKSLQGAELRGKTMGILGLGRIGLEVARRARTFGMEVVGHDPFERRRISSDHRLNPFIIQLANLLFDFDRRSSRVWSCGIHGMFFSKREADTASTPNRCASQLKFACRDLCKGVLKQCLAVSGVKIDYPQTSLFSPRNLSPLTTHVV